uniref:Uncharacterized protein n=1 Tax=Arundo donax TaxID=35708 RepID=A0A0A8ZRH1_ARUDO
MGLGWKEIGNGCAVKGVLSSQLVSCTYPFCLLALVISLF